MRRYERIAEAYGTAFEILFPSIVLRNGAPQTSIYLLYGFSEEKYTKYGSVSTGFSLAAAGTAAYNFFYETVNFADLLLQFCVDALIICCMLNS